MKSQNTPRRSISELVPTGHSKYPVSKVLEVAANFVVLGKADKAGALSGVPARTAQSWTTQPWWPDLIHQIREDKAEELDAMLTGLVHSAVETAQDRVSNGDYKLRPDGTTVRVPVSARDAMLTGAIAYDKRQIGRNLPTSITQDATERLRLLMDQMRTVSGRTIDQSTTDQ